jgi:hypothetical protein
MRNLTAHLNRRFLKLLPAALIIVLILGIIGPNTASANPGWYNTSWQHRKKITIHAAGVSADLTDFPLLIYLGSDADLAADAQNDGDDIIFTAADEVTRLSHEIEYFDGATGNLTAWVKIPSLSSTTDTEIYMYYGNAGAANSENVTDVWDVNYKMVQHLEETSGTHNDSTQYNNDGTPIISPASNQNAMGKIDGADDLDGNDFISLAASNSILPSNVNFTVSAWAKLDTVRAGTYAPNRIFTILENATNSNFALGVSSDSKIAGFTRNGGTAVEFKGGTINTGQWYYFTLVKQGTTHQLYLNGSTSGSAVNYTPTNQPSIDNAAIGQDTFSGSRFWDGIIDEVQVSDIARTPDWITTSYNNQVNPAGFYTLGPEENATVLPTVTTNDATVVQETTATLNGYLNNDGGSACQYAFEWGTASGVYTANISWTGSINTGANFSTNLIGLTKGQPYYYRAMVKNASGVAYGGEIHFLTKPDGPVVLTATANSSSRIDLTWTKGTGAQRTMIRRSTGTYPASYMDGDEVYYDTGTNFSDTGLADNITFYYRAWSEVTGSQQFSNTFASASAKTFAAQQVSPSIIGGKVYSVNKAAVLLPWILGSLVAAFILIQIFFYVRKKIKSRQHSGKIAPYKSKPPP